MKLPLNCEVDYVADFLSEEESNELYTSLIENYKLDQSRIIINAGGKLIKTDSFKILFASERLINENSHPEEIHGKSFLWRGSLKKLKEKVQDLLKKEFELAMCLYYPDGNYFAPYHSDQETSGFNTILPSISLGEVREFSFKDKISNELYNLDLANGSLLVMGAHCQSRYTHSLLQNSKFQQGRINITFREPEFQ
ncbi:2OG-Fe(II) oxygenase superfamily protein [Maribacter orientalis]|uniref:2OG-Fe(II) oxygenase superfamily protein n=1 Tax=Maribacter orientalis TaxID=228957 RepID=A0A1H7QMK7_9FLAO|nr:alpha-ketoglutarate-dependent dioxygenase AlkB [Maribacter orientalis]SEL48835.1 2OG-Fe(II) oxygenase superfamily protein [Maribacter orientalis]|tara:strand:+ start:4997 stop:5584 length:588 start_codon:yes stop_codon:yes gene_type:complete